VRYSASLETFPTSLETGYLNVNLNSNKNLRL
jgi:hypothetical protein